MFALPFPENERWSTEDGWSSVCVDSSLEIEPYNSNRKKPDVILTLVTSMDLF